MAVAAGGVGVPRHEHGWLMRALDSKPVLIFICLLPALGILVLFLTYPLGLGIWLAFTDATLGAVFAEETSRRHPECGRGHRDAAFAISLCAIGAD